MPLRTPARRRCWPELLLVGAAAALVGCAPTSSESPRSSPPATTAVLPSGDGAVVGGIDACYGIPPRKRPAFVAGTVTALSGTVSRLPEPGGVTTDVLPATIVSSQKVAQRHLYRFILGPGPYVIVAKLASRSNFEPWISVMVSVGKKTEADIPNVCK